MFYSKADSDNSSGIDKTDLNKPYSTPVCTLKNLRQTKYFNSLILNINNNYMYSVTKRLMKYHRFILLKYTLI